MKKLILLVVALMLTITLSGCQAEPYVVEVEKEVVVIQTVTEVVTVETDVVVPSVNEFGFKVNESDVIQFFFNRDTEVYVLITEYVNPLISDAYYTSKGIAHYSNGIFVGSFTFAEEDKIFSYDTDEDYIAGVLLQTDYVSISDIYDELETASEVTPDE